MVGEEGSEQIGGHERVGVGDKGGGFRDDRGLGGVLVLGGGRGGVFMVREVFTFPPWQWE